MLDPGGGPPRRERTARAHRRPELARNPFASTRMKTAISSTSSSSESRVARPPTSPEKRPNRRSKWTACRPPAPARGRDRPTAGPALRAAPGRRRTPPRSCRPRGDEGPDAEHQERQAEQHGEDREPARHPAGAQPAQDPQRRHGEEVAEHHGEEDRGRRHLSPPPRRPGPPPRPPGGARAAPELQTLAGDSARGRGRSGGSCFESRKKERIERNQTFNSLSQASLGSLQDLHRHAVCTLCSFALSLGSTARAWAAMPAAGGSASLRKPRAPPRQVQCLPSSRAHPRRTCTSGRGSAIGWINGGCSSISTGPRRARSRCPCGCRLSTGRAASASTRHCVSRHNGTIIVAERQVRSPAVDSAQHVSLLSHLRRSWAPRSAPRGTRPRGEHARLGHLATSQAAPFVGWRRPGSRRGARIDGSDVVFGFDSRRAGGTRAPREALSAGTTAGCARLRLAPELGARVAGPPPPRHPAQRTPEAIAAETAPAGAEPPAVYPIGHRASDAAAGLHSGARPPRRADPGRLPARRRQPPPRGGSRGLHRVARGHGAPGGSGRARRSLDHLRAGGGLAQALSAERSAGGTEPTGVRERRGAGHTLRPASGGGTADADRRFKANPERRRPRFWPCIPSSIPIRRCAPRR